MDLARRTVSAVALCAAMPAVARAELSAVTSDGGLWKVSTSDATATLVGNGTYGASPGSLEWNPADNSLWCATIGVSPSFYNVNATNGQATLVGPTNLGFIFEG